MNNEFVGVLKELHQYSPTLVESIYKAYCICEGKVMAQPLSDSWNPDDMEMDAHATPWGQDDGSEEQIDLGTSDDVYDDATAALGGDLQFKSEDELDKEISGERLSDAQLFDYQIAGLAERNPWYTEYVESHPGVNMKMLGETCIYIDKNPVLSQYMKKYPNADPFALIRDYRRLLSNGWTHEAPPAHRNGWLPDRLRSENTQLDYHTVEDFIEQLNDDLEYHANQLVGVNSENYNILKDRYAALNGHTGLMTRKPGVQHYTPKQKTGYNRHIDQTFANRDENGLNFGF